MEVKGLSYLGICRVLKARHNLSQPRIPSDYSCQARSRSFPFLLLLPLQQSHLHTSYAMIWIRKPEQLREGRGGGERQLTHLRKQSASPLSVFTTYPPADTMWEQEPEQAMTATSAATTTRKVHLEITASESKLLPGKPAQGAE